MLYFLNLLILFRFAKNLSPDKLHLSTLKGHGELRNLELNEKVLTELLELPAWLNLTRATCNHVTLQVCSFTFDNILKAYFFFTFFRAGTKKKKKLNQLVWIFLGVFGEFCSTFH